MVYFIKSKEGKLSLPTLRYLVLQTIANMDYRSRNYKVLPFEPKILESKNRVDHYILGRIIDPDGNGFDSLMASHIRFPAVVGEDFLKITESLDFIADWIVQCGLESAHGFDTGPLHKNLSEERISQAISLGQKIKRYVRGIENIAFVHYHVNNRDIIPCIEKIE